MKACMDSGVLRSAGQLVSWSGKRLPSVTSHSVVTMSATERYKSWIKLVNWIFVSNTHTQRVCWCQWHFHVARQAVGLSEAESLRRSRAVRLYLAENLQVVVLVQVQHVSREVRRDALSAHLSLKLPKRAELIRQTWELNFNNNFGAAEKLWIDKSGVSANAFQNKTHDVLI